MFSNVMFENPNEWYLKTTELLTRNFCRIIKRPVYVYVLVDKGEIIATRTDAGASSV